MESESRYALVGAFTLSILVAAVFFTLWLGQVSFDQEYIEYDVVFEGPVRGLSKSGEVRFNGIKVGEVTNLGLDKTDPNNIVVARIKIFAETPVKQDSYAQLEPQGITGLSYIQIDGGSANSPPLKKAPGELYAKIPSHQAQLDELFAGADDLMLAANAALVRINVLFSTQNMTRFSDVLENLQVVTDRLAAEKTLFSDFDSLIRSAGAAADEAASAAAAVQALSTSGEEVLSKDAKAMVLAFTDAAVQLEEASTKANAFMDKVSDPLAEFSTEGLSELTLTLTQLRMLTQTLEQVMEEIDRNPGEFISGEPVKEIEVPR
jgi:phospholipid/cholesterol/gamma-HCH transport system substrate-binding protein